MAGEQSVVAKFAASQAHPLPPVATAGLQPMFDELLVMAMAIALLVVVLHCECYIGQQ